MRTVAAGVVLLLAAVSGCSAEDAAPAEVGPLASSSATASPVPASPEGMPESLSRPTEAPVRLPGQANSVSAEGASAFARYYIALVNEGFSTADATAVREVSHPACEGCRNLIEAIEGPSAPGERIEGGDFLVAFAESRELAPGDALVDIRYSVEPLFVLDVEGRVVDQRPGTAAIDGQMRLLHESHGWTVRGFRNAAP